MQRKKRSISTRGNSTPSIAIVTPDVMGPVHNGGVGTSCANLAIFLAKIGYEVDLIYASFHQPDKKWIDFYQRQSVRLLCAGEMPFEIYCGNHFSWASYATYEFLRMRNYPLVIFPDMGGIGYFSQMAKVNGLAFQNTKFLVKFLGPLAWSTPANGEFFHRPGELTIPMIEKFSVENADMVQLATGWSRTWCAENKWQLKNSTEALFPFAVPATRRATTGKSSFREIVFFGRIEPRKGILEFLEAIAILNQEGKLQGKSVTLLGRWGSLKYLNIHGIIARFSKKHSIPIQVIDHMQSFEAIKYLRQKRDRIAVLPSQSETMGLTLIECLANEIPFIATDIAPFREMLGPAHSEHLFSVSDPRSIASILGRALETGRAILDHDRAKELQNETEKRWKKIISDTFQLPATKTATTSTSAPSISVLIAHHNRAGYLKEALQSLLGQTLPPFEVCIYDDASPNKDFRDIVESFRARFETKGVGLHLHEAVSNRGPSFARNFLASHARGNFLLFMDDDNRATRDEIEILTRIQRNRDYDVVVVAIKKFIDGQEGLWLERRWCPIGFDLNCALFENSFGDTNFLMRKSTFEKVGGFVDNPVITAEDMNILIRAAIIKSKMTVCPKPLVEYRVHPLNRSRERDSSERIFHIRFFMNYLAQQAGIENLDTLSSMLAAWSHETNYHWLPEPPFWPKRIAEDQSKTIKLSNRLEKLVSTGKVKKFGAAFEITLDRNGRFSISRKALANIPVTDLFLDLRCVVEKPCTLTTSNPNSNFNCQSGVAVVRLPFPAKTEVFEFQFNGLKRVFVTELNIIYEVNGLSAPQDEPANILAPAEVDHFELT